MKVATYNVNGVNGRLDVLLRWLEEASPDVVALQELKAPQEKFPVKAIEAAGYGAVLQGQKSWNGVALLAKDQQPHLTRKGLPGEPEDEQSRYVEEIVDGTVLGALYLPNGNPYPGPKFDYNSAGSSGFTSTRLSFSLSRYLLFSWATLTSCRPTWTCINRSVGRTTPCFVSGCGKLTRISLTRDGQMRSGTFIPGERIYTFWDYFRNAYGRDAGLRIDHFLLSPEVSPRLRNAQVDRHVRGWEHTSDQAPVWINLADVSSER